jgi:hypothetical protein
VCDPRDPVGTAVEYTALAKKLRGNPSSWMVIRILDHHGSVVEHPIRSVLKD